MRVVLGFFLLMSAIAALSVSSPERADAKGGDPVSPIEGSLGTVVSISYYGAWGPDQEVRLMATTSPVKNVAPAQAVWSPLASARAHDGGINFELPMQDQGGLVIPREPGYVLFNFDRRSL